MILISRKDPGAAIFEVDLHDAEAGCVSRRMAKIDSRCNLQKWSVKRLPVEIEAQILWQIDPNVTLRGDGVVSMFDLLLMHIDWYVRSLEVLQASGMLHKR